MEIFIRIYKTDHTDNIDLEGITGYRIIFYDRSFELEFVIEVKNNIVDECVFCEYPSMRNRFKVNLDIDEELISNIPYLCKQYTIKQCKYLTKGCMKLYFNNNSVELPTDSCLYEFLVYVKNKFMRLKNAHANIDLTDLKINNYKLDKKFQLGIYNLYTTFEVLGDNMYIEISNDGNIYFRYINHITNHNFNISNINMDKIRSIELFNKYCTRQNFGIVNPSINDDIYYMYNYIRSANDYITEQLKNALITNTKSARN